MVSHQVGVWLGGKAFEATGSYDWMWYVDIVLALGAALVHLSFDRLRTALRQAQDGRRIPFGLSLSFDRLRTVGRSRSG